MHAGKAQRSLMLHAATQQMQAAGGSGRLGAGEGSAGAAALQHARRLRGSCLRCRRLAQPLGVALVELLREALPQLLHAAQTTPLWHAG